MTLPSPPPRIAVPPTLAVKPPSPPTTRRTICRWGSSASTSATTSSSAPSSTTAAEIRPSPMASSPTANLETFYVDDKFKPFSWLTLSAGHAPHAFLRRQLLPPAQPRRQSTESAISRASALPSPSPSCAGHSAPSTDTTIKRRPSRPSPVRAVNYTGHKAWVSAAPRRAR